MRPGCVRRHETQRDGPMLEFTLSPMLATGIFVVSCLCGHRYRKVWKADGPNWQLWMFGGLAAMGLLVLGFVLVRLDA